MTHREFFNKVEKMRSAQQAYFKYRSPDYLAIAKGLEKEVDEEIKRVNNMLANKNTPIQTSLPL